MELCLQNKHTVCLYDLKSSKQEKHYSSNHKTTVKLQQIQGTWYYENKKDLIESDNSDYRFLDKWQLPCLNLCYKYISPKYGGALRNQ